MNDRLTLEWDFEVARPGRRRTRKDTRQPEPTGKLPRIARLMGLAIEFDGMLSDGIFSDYADLAHLGLVTRARMTQIMNLLNLAPDIQEQILFLAERRQGRDKIAERKLRSLAAIASRNRQRTLWRHITKGH